MIKTRSQRGEFFQYTKQIEELVQGLQNTLVRITNTLNKNNKEANNIYKYHKFNQKGLKKFTENNKLKCKLEKLKAEKNKAAESNERVDNRYL